MAWGPLADEAAASDDWMGSGLKLLLVSEKDSTAVAEGQKVPAMVLEMVMLCLGVVHPPSDYSYHYFKMSWNLKIKNDEGFSRKTYFTELKMVAATASSEEGLAMPILLSGVEDPGKARGIYGLPDDPAAIVEDHRPVLETFFTLVSRLLPVY